MWTRQWSWLHNEVVVFVMLMLCFIDVVKPIMVWSSLVWVIPMSITFWKLSMHCFMRLLETSLLWLSSLCLIVVLLTVQLLFTICMTVTMNHRYILQCRECALRNLHHYYFGSINQQPIQKSATWSARWHWAERHFLAVWIVTIIHTPSPLLKYATSLKPQEFIWVPSLRISTMCSAFDTAGIV